MAQSDHWREVAAASTVLSDRKLLDVVALIDQLPDAERPEQVLAAMRPRLAQLRPPRRLTIQRLMFLPVEDLFDPPELYRRKIGRLSRGVVRVCWRVLSETGDAALVAATTEKLKAMETHHPLEVLPLGHAIWQSGSATLGRALAIAAKDTKASIRMFGRDEDILRQITDIATILEIGADIEAAKLDLPAKPIPVISTGQAALLAGMVLRLGTDSLAKAKTFLLVLAARMVRPGDLLEVMAQVKLPCSTHERDGLVQDIEASMVANLVREAQTLRGNEEAGKDPIAATETARRLIEGFTSLRKSLKSMTDTGAVAKVQSARREIAGFIMGKVIDRADTSLFDLMTPPGGAAGAVPAVELLNDDQLEALETFALSLRHCATMSEAVGIQREVTAKLRKICADLEQHTAAPGLNTEARERRLYATLRLIEMIDGPDAAERLWLAAGGRG